MNFLQTLRHSAQAETNEVGLEDLSRCLSDEGGTISGLISADEIDEDLLSAEMTIDMRTLLREALVALRAAHKLVQDAKSEMEAVRTDRHYMTDRQEQAYDYYQGAM